MKTSAVTYAHERAVVSSDKFLA